MIEKKLTLTKDDRQPRYLNPHTNKEIKMNTKINLQDIEDLETLMNKAVYIKQQGLEQNQPATYPTSFKKETVRLRFKLGVDNKAMNNELGLPTGSCENWSMHYSVSRIHAVGQLHGKGVRYDIPTKAHIVKLHIEDGIPGHKLAEMYGVSQPTISTWKRAYKDCYQDYIHGLEGTMIIGKEDKRVTSLANIKKIQFITEQAEAIARKAILATQSLKHDALDITYAMSAMEKINNSLSEPEA